MRRDGADAPWCGHCKKLAPTYEKVANYFHEKNAGVHVAKIDATEHQGLASRFDIKGYPTLLLFREDRKVADFSGPRCARAPAHSPSTAAPFRRSVHARPRACPRRTYENIVQWVEQHADSKGGTAIPKAKATSRSEAPVKPSAAAAAARRATAGPPLKARARARPRAAPASSHARPGPARHAARLACPQPARSEPAAEALGEARASQRLSPRPEPSRDALVARPWEPRPDPPSTGAAALAAN